MEKKKYFKMYKSGKLWVTAALVGFSVMAGTAISDQQVKADTVQPVVTQSTNAAANDSSTPGQTPSNGTNGQNTADQNNQGDQDNNNQTTSETTSEKVQRTVNFVTADGKTLGKPQQQTATVKKVTTNDGKLSFDVSRATWSGVTLPQENGMTPTFNGKVNGKVITELLRKVDTTNDGQVDTSAINIVFLNNTLEYKKANITDDDLKNTDMYRKITRTINITQPDGKTTKSIVQNIYYGRDGKINADGKYDYSGDWNLIDADEVDIPSETNYIASYKDKDQTHYVTKNITTQGINKTDSNPSTLPAIDITYVPVSSETKPESVKEGDKDYNDFWRTITRTITYQFADGTQVGKPFTQKVKFNRTRTIVLKDNGQKQETTFSEWTAVNNSVWDAVTFEQRQYYHTELSGAGINGRERAAQLSAEAVNANTKDENYVVTYVSDGTDPYNLRVVAGLNGNWASIDNIYMTDTGIHVTGWNANSDSYNRNYHYLIILDYGQNPVVGQFHEVGRKLVTGGVSRPDVFAVHPVWNAATSGFDDTVDLDLSQIKSGDKLRILSRWTSDPNGNNDVADLVSSYYTMDYNTNVGNLDSMAVDGNQLHVSGWNATNQRVGRDHHFIILFDATTGREISRQEVKNGISRPDVSNVYPNILDASQSGFDVNFNLTGVNLAHNLQVISRYSDGANGEGSNVDYWFPAKRLISGDAGNYANFDGAKMDLDSGKMIFNGWNATNMSQVEPNHFLILYDSTANQQVDAVKLDEKNGLTERNDVQRVYRGIKNAADSGFSYGFDASKLIYGHTYSLVSRYSTSDQGNGGDGAYTDYWLTNVLNFNQQAYNIDLAQLTAESPAANQPATQADTENNSDQDNNKNDQTPTTNQSKLHVEGWMASDAAINIKNTYVIVLDAKNSQELGRSQVTLQDRPDVANVYSSIYNAGKSGFKTDIELSDANSKLAQADGIKFVLRYTDGVGGNPTDKDGKTVPSADQWTKSFSYNRATNTFA